jgi:hypothetical protein
LEKYEWERKVKRGIEGKEDGKREFGEKKKL